MNAIIRFTAATLTLVATVVHAGFPAWYPQEGFNNVGKIDELRTEDSVLIVDDRYYRFADNLKVHSLSQKNDSVARLRQGTTVGFEVDVTPQGERLVREVWLLPDTYTQPDDSLTTAPGERPVHVGRPR